MKPSKWQLCALYALASFFFLLSVQNALAQCPAAAAIIPWPLPPGNPITAAMPSSIYDGSVTTLRVTGNITSTWKLLICPKDATSVSTEAIPTVKPDTISDSVLQVTVTAAPGSAGDYAILIQDNAGHIYDTGKTLTISSSDDTKYVPCAAPAARGKPNKDLACSFVPFSHETALEVFGKGVANRFVAVQVTVRNKNANLEYLLQDIRIGQPGFVLSSYDRKIPRAVSEKEEQFSARAIIVRLSAASASILTGVAGFAGNAILQNAANIFAGPGQTALQNAIPDLSASELTRMDDLGFSTASTVIPKSSAIAVVAFIPADTLDRDKTVPKHWYNPQQNSYSTYQGPMLQQFFTSLTVSVAGTHVQEVNPSQPTLKLFIPASSDTVPLTSLRAGTFTATIQGSGLDGVTQVQLSNSTDSKTVLPAKLQPLAGETTLDPNVASLTIPATTSATVGSYGITFVLSDGSLVKTGQAITVVPGALTLSATHGAVDSSLTITGAGFGTTQGNSTVLIGGIAASVTAWTSDTSITVKVPDRTSATPSVVVTVSGISSSPAAFAVP